MTLHNYTDEEMERWDMVYNPETRKRIEEQFDALEWARTFMERYEKKHGSN